MSKPLGCAENTAKVNDKSRISAYEEYIKKEHLCLKKQLFLTCKILGQPERLLFSNQVDGKKIKRE